MFAIADSQLFLEAAPAYVVNGWVGADHLECVLTPASTHPRRHGRDYNVLFCDTHVAALDPLRLFNPTNTAVEWNNDHQGHPDIWMENWEGNE
jgi:prepilin-type processing-associated H-X9-DG protein